jgi:hypothetical protein
VFLVSFCFPIEPKRLFILWHFFSTLGIRIFVSLVKWPNSFRNITPVRPTRLLRWTRNLDVTGPVRLTVAPVPSEDQRL